MRALLLTGVFCFAVTAHAQTPEPVSCKAIAAQVTMKLVGVALEGESATQDEKRVFGEFQRGVVEECVKADGENCYTHLPGELRTSPTNCPKDPVHTWMATSAGQIIPTQTQQNRATAVLQGLLNKPPEPEPPAPPPPSTGAALPPPTPPPPPVEAPPPPPPARPVAEDAPMLDTGDILTRPLNGMSQRELRGTQTLLEEQRPGLGLTLDPGVVASHANA